MTADRDVDLSRRLYRGLTAGLEELLPLLDDPSREVLKAVLKNPNLDESSLLHLLKRRDLTDDLLTAMYRLPLTETSHRLKVALVHHHATPDHIVLTLIPQLYLFELVTVCFLPGITPDRRLVAERALIKRLADTPLGSKITLARRAPSEVVEALLHEGQPQLMAACLDNPRLKQAAILRFLSGPGATAETISVIARHPRWKSRHELKLAILKNSKTPLIWFTALLPGLSLVEVKNIYASSRISAAQKACVAEELLRRKGRR
ncbi:MAG: hypothetical protein EG822_09655 [Deltaproteobacteria bacterium]|nr:hypothetical protein [Deltaproteobacteria bacterium]TLN02911.1 MAG: hypothetical protein FDZ73_10020 [bacterium]